MRNVSNRFCSWLVNQNVTPQARADIKYYYDFGTHLPSHMVVVNLIKIIQGD